MCVCLWVSVCALSKVECSSKQVCAIRELLVFYLRAMNGNQWINFANLMNTVSALKSVRLIHSHALVWIDCFMSSIRDINDACPIHQGFLQALLAFQNACNTDYHSYKTPTATKYRQSLGRCTCLLHRILIQVKSKCITNISYLMMQKQLSQTNISPKNDCYCFTVTNIKYSLIKFHCKWKFSLDEKTNNNEMAKYLPR